MEDMDALLEKSGFGGWVESESTNPSTGEVKFWVLGFKPPAVEEDGIDIVRPPEVCSI